MVIGVILFSESAEKLSHHHNIITNYFTKNDDQVEEIFQYI